MSKVIIQLQQDIDESEENEDESNSKIFTKPTKQF